MPSPILDATNLELNAKFSVSKILYGKPERISLPESCRSPVESTIRSSAGTQTCQAMSAVGIGMDGLEAVTMVASNGATKSTSVRIPTFRLGVS